MVFLMLEKMPSEKKPVSEFKHLSHNKRCGKVKLQVYGYEMVEKVVKLNTNSGRVYLAPDWVGRRVKIIRLD
jgi:hypothetical protein